jgi:thiamine monophosphate kinase
VEDEALKDKDGMPVRWAIEWGAAGQLAQQGVNSGSLKVGDKVAVTGSPGRNADDHRLRLRSITRPSDGWKWPVGNQTFN